MIENEEFFGYPTIDKTCIYSYNAFMDIQN